MNKKILPFVLSYLLLAIFTIIYIIQKNYEFLFYIVTIAGFTYLLQFIDKKIKLLSIARWGYFSWLLLHMLGGSLYINGTRLYDLILVPIVGEPYNILKYDQVMHFFCYIVMAWIMYSFLITLIEKREKQNHILFWVILVLAASSIGAFNEILEFATVVLFNSTEVGGYYNTALDLVFNVIGAISGAFIIWSVKK